MRPILGILLFVAAAEAADPKQLRELLERAKAAEASKDLDSAIQLYSQAVDLDPQNVELRMARAVFLLGSLQLVEDPELAERVAKVARAELEWVSEKSPSDRNGGIARDALARLDGRDWFPTRPVDCPPEALSKIGEAESLFRADRFEEAIPVYQEARTLCPQAGDLWVNQGDALYALGRMDEARDAYARGLELDRWNRGGHRFYADAEAAAGRLESAYEQALLSVLSDPGYEAGWSSLRNFCELRGGRFRRLYSSKADIELDADKNYHIRLMPQEIPADAPVWMAYGLAKILYSMAAAAKAPPEPDADPATLAAFEAVRGLKAPPTPLQRERFASGMALRAFRESGRPRDDSFWGRIDEAEAAGFLDEAIFLMLLDEALVPEYIEYRDRHGERLAQFVRTVLAPVGAPPRTPQGTGVP